MSNLYGHFDGAAVTAQDTPRLQTQLEKVYAFMKDGKPRTIAEIESATGEPACSVSAQLRNLRKARFGGYTVSRAYIGDGLSIYSVQAAKVQMI